MHRGHGSQEMCPKAAVMCLAEDVRLRSDRKPRLTFEFVFELAWAPTGVADEGANDAAWLACVFGSLFGRDADCPAQAEFWAPPKRGKCHLLKHHRPALMDGEIAQRGKFMTLEKIAHDLAGGLVEDDSGRAVFGCVGGEQDHRAVESAISQ